MTFTLADLRPGVEFRTIERYPRYWFGSDGSVIGPSGRVLKPGTIPPLGYQQILIYLDTGRVGRLTRTVHPLICEAFHGPKPTPKHHAAHWDGNPRNNNADNLRWATAKENIADKIRHGRVTRTSGETNGMSRLTAAAVADIRLRAAAGVPQPVLAAEYGVKQPTISNIVTRKTWFHV